MRKTIFIFALLLTAFSATNAQNSSKSKFDPAKLIFGGTIGFGISNDSWTIGAAPQIGYKLTNKLHVGAGLGYRYGKENVDYLFAGTDANGESFLQTGDYKLVENSLSLNLFANYFPWKKLIFSVRPEIIHNWYREEFEGIEKKSSTKLVPAVTVGGGVYLRPFILQLNYELVQSKYSPYSDNLFLSIGFLF